MADTTIQRAKSFVENSPNNKIACTTLYETVAREKKS